MITWLDAYLIPFLVGVPWLGMFFVAAMPGTDRIALRHAGLGASIVTAAFGLRAAYLALSAGGATAALTLTTTWGGTVPGGMSLGIDAARAPLLLSIVVLAPMILRAGAPRILLRTKGYVLLVLVFQALAVAALLSEHALLTLALLDASALPLLLLLGLFGGPGKGTTSLRVGMSWLVVDAVAFAALGWLVARSPGGDARSLAEVARELSLEQQLLVFVPVALAAGLRLAVAPACAWFVNFQREAPVSAAAFAVAAVMPLGAWLFYQWALVILPAAALAALPVILALAALTCLLGGAVAIVGRDLRLLSAGAGMVHGGVALLGLASLEPRAVAAALLFVPAAGAASALLLFCSDALERRYLTRDSTELFGVAEELPGLMRVMLLAFAAVACLPFLGGGSLVLPILEGTLEGRALAASGVVPNLGLLFATLVVLGFVLLTSGIVVAVRRLSSPHFRQEVRARISFSVWQSVRLWLPGTLLVVVGVLAPLLVGLLADDTARRIGPVLGEREAPAVQDPP